MAKPRTWRDLHVGIIAALAVLGTAVATLMYARAGSLHGDTFRLYLAIDEARGVIRGTEVMLDGQKVGLVSEIDFAPPAANRKGLVVRLDVLESVHSHVRLDSRADVRNGGSLISSPVLYLRSGTPSARQVNEGDTLAAVAQSDFEGAASRATLAAQDLPGILSDMKTVAGSMRTMNGNVGSLRAEGGNRIRTMASRLAHVMTPAWSLRRSLGPVTSATTTLADRVATTLARRDSIRALLASDRGSLGRFRRDSTLQGHIAAIRTELDSVRALALKGDGSLGRAHRDSALVDAIADARRQLDSLWTDMHRRPGRYLVF